MTQEFLILVRHKTRGARVVEDVPELRAQIEQAGDSCGVKLKDFKYVFGRYNVVLACEAEDFHQIADFSAAVERLSNLETQTLWVLSREEFLQLLGITYPELTSR
ncbi:MAG: GYD domain-containing protein [Candidatus Acidiferrales bacterium]